MYLPVQKYSCKQSIWDAALPPSKGPCHLLQFALELSKRESLDASQAFTQHLPSWEPLTPTGFCAQCSRHSSTTFQSLLGCKRKTPQLFCQHGQGAGTSRSQQSPSSPSPPTSCTRTQRYRCASGQILSSQDQGSHGTVRSPVHTHETFQGWCEGPPAGGTGPEPRSLHAPRAGWPRPQLCPFAGEPSFHGTSSLHPPAFAFCWTDANCKHRTTVGIIPSLHHLFSKA